MALNLDNLFQKAERYLEPSTTITTSLLAEPVAGLAGLATGNPDMVKKVHHDLTYMPRTKEGQKGLQDLGEYMQGVGGEIMDTPYLGQAIRNFNRSADALGAWSPAAGAGLKTLPTAVALMIAPEARAASRAVGGGIAREIMKGPNVRVGPAAQKGMVNLSALQPMMQSSRHLARAATDFSPATLERAVAQVGRNLERTHKATIAEKTASDVSEEQRQAEEMRRLLAQ